MLAFTVQLFLAPAASIPQSTSCSISRSDPSNNCTSHSRRCVCVYLTRSCFGLPCIAWRQSRPRSATPLCPRCPRRSIVISQSRACMHVRLSVAHEGSHANLHRQPCFHTVHRRGGVTTRGQPQSGTNGVCATGCMPHVWKLRCRLQHVRRIPKRRGRYETQVRSASVLLDLRSSMLTHGASNLQRLALVILSKLSRVYIEPSRAK